MTICDRPISVSSDLLFLIFQALNIIAIRVVQLTDSLIVIKDQNGMRFLF